MKATKKTAGETANENGAQMRSYDYTLTALDLAVIRQLGGEGRNTAEGCEISEDAAEELVNVRGCSCGAAGGFTGFTWYSDTREFTAANRKAIVAGLREQVDEGVFTDENGKPRGVIGAVMMFACLKDEDPAVIEEEAARVLFGPLKDIRSGDLDIVANALAWGALEDLAFALDGREVAND